MEEKTVRCTVCRSEFTGSEIEGKVSCLRCGTNLMPEAIEDDVELTINKRAIRILTIWASNWAEKHCPPECMEEIDRIISGISDQVPGITLSMRDEIHQLADGFDRGAAEGQAGK